MKNVNMTEANLDDPNDVEEFIKCYGNERGRRLANRLGIRGKGSAKLANRLSGYAWNKWTAIGCRLRGEIETARMYERICDCIYAELPGPYRW